METDAQRVREALARELETISRYEALAAGAELPEVRAFILHLAAEEKEHVAEATQLLRRLDPEQDRQLQKPFAATHFEAAAAPGTGPPLVSARQALYATPAPPTPHGEKLTVGSLRGNNA